MNDNLVSTSLHLARPETIEARFMDCSKGDFIVLDLDYGHSVFFLNKDTVKAVLSKLNNALEKWGD